MTLRTLQSSVLGNLDFLEWKWIQSGKNGNCHVASVIHTFDGSSSMNSIPQPIGVHVCDFRHGDSDRFSMKMWKGTRIEAEEIETQHDQAKHFDEEPDENEGLLMHPSMA
jgi:hypothetical protein